MSKLLVTWMGLMGLMLLVAVGEVGAANEATSSPEGVTDAGSGPALSRYYDLREEGWFWYHDPPPKRKAAVVPPSPGALPPSPDPRDLIKAQREALDRAMAQAVLHPTPENISAYLELNYQTIRQAGRFADAWQHTLWNRPTLDHTLVSPVGAGAYLQADEQGAEREARLLGASKRYGLLLFFRGSCGYCHRLAPILKGFAGRYGFEVIAVSLDGGGLSDFPNAQPNVAAAAQLQVEAVPAVFLINAATRTVVPAVFGYVGFSELAQRIDHAIEVVEQKTQLADTGDSP